MKKILICVNGVSSRSGGGLSILTNLVASFALLKSKKFVFFVLVPINFKDKFEYPKHIKIIRFPLPSYLNFLYPLLNITILPWLICKLKCHALLNLSDIPMPIKVKQIFLFDWAYAAYPEKINLLTMPVSAFLKRKLKFYLFFYYSRYIDICIVQTEIFKKKLDMLYKIPHIEVMNNAVSLDKISDLRSKFILGSGYKLLYLTHYYSHKNIEILLPLAKEILSRDLDIKLITTLDPKEHKNAQNFLNEIASNNLSSVILNIGTVKMSDVPKLYNSVDAIIMPSLLESFSGTHIEALYYGKTIFTSDLDFAHSACKNAAYYFNPHSHVDILETIVQGMKNKKMSKQKILYGKKILKNFFTWPQIAKKMILLFDDLFITSRK
jgi:glycosyltransferase involved in cell wall biosynthesis